MFVHAIKGFSVHAEQKYYGRNKYFMHAVHERYQAVATKRNTMPAEDILQDIPLW